MGQSETGERETGTRYQAVRLGTEIMLAKPPVSVGLRIVRLGL
jgi:hypothetical protein